MRSPRHARAPLGELAEIAAVAVLVGVGVGVGVAVPASAKAGTNEDATTWAGATESPMPTEHESLPPLERAALARCGTGDSGLKQAARTIAARKARSLPMPELDPIAYAHRAA